MRKARGAWGGTGTGPGGYRGRRRETPAAPAVSGHCPCGGTYRWLPREERGFLVPGSAAMRCDRCGAERPRANPRWRYAVEVRYADSEAPWE